MKPILFIFGFIFGAVMRFLFVIIMIAFSIDAIAQELPSQELSYLKPKTYSTYWNISVEGSYYNNNEINVINIADWFIEGSITFVTKLPLFNGQVGFGISGFYDNNRYIDKSIGYSENIIGYGFEAGFSDNWKDIPIMPWVKGDMSIEAGSGWATFTYNNTRQIIDIPVYMSIEIRPYIYKRSDYNLFYFSIGVKYSYGLVSSNKEWLGLFGLGYEFEP